MAIILNPGSMFDNNKYQIMMEIGRGRVGTVYQAKRLSDKTTVALKIADIYGDKETKKRLDREIRMMKTIDHPNVMKILDAGEFNDMIYIVMPLARNTISKEIPSIKGDLKKVIAIFDEICLGVHAMHIAGVFHRDIKPSNTLRMPDGRIVVSDLGIGRFDERDTETITKTNASLGTAAYFAPEQCTPGGAREANARADVFQLGKTLYQLYVDELPMYMNLDKVPLLSLRHVITRATKREKEERYQTVSELMDAVRLCLQSIDPSLNPKAAFESIRNAIMEAVNQGQYNGVQIAELLALATKLVEINVSTGLTSFDTIDGSILKIAAQYVPDDSIRFLKVYVKAIEENMKNYGFEYAQVVARSMKLMFKATSNTEVKALAMEATLIAAVDRHRFAAMDTFSEMLRSVKDDESLAIAEMLKRRISFYKMVARQIGDGELPTVLDATRKEAVGMGN